MILSPLLFLVLEWIAARPVLSQESVARITVSTKIELPANTPVSVSLKKLPDRLQSRALQMVEITNGATHPLQLQIEDDGSAELWWQLPNTTESGQKRIFELRSGKSVFVPFVELAMDETGLAVAKGKSQALRYNYGLIPPPESQNKLYTRSGFIHPIWTPAGKILTRIHPSDHLHHLGFWHPWTKTEFEGRKVDFWNLGEGQGTVRFVRFRNLHSGPVYASFLTDHEYVDLTAPGGEKVALKENCRTRVWNPGDGKMWIWDFSIEQSCATDSPLTVLKYRYSGFGFRATADWHDKNSTVLTSEGKTRSEANGSRARWCRVQGETDDGDAGIVFLSHPQNHEFPEPMRVWPSGDVFVGFCPVVYSNWKLLPGKKYKRSYRIIVYDGTLEAEQAERYWQAFAHPPGVKIEWLSK